jgi:phosphonate transport system substrate-binding protein
MTEGPKAENAPLPRRRRNGALQSWTMAILIVVVLGTIAYVANFARWTLAARELALQTQEAAVRGYGLVEPTHKVLDPKFTDSHGNLTADPPADASQFVNPAVLVVAHLGDDSDDPEVNWTKLEAHLAEVTGKQVQDVIWTNSADQIQSIDRGAITIVALHAADAPFLVNNYGFEPCAVLADQGGISGHKMDIIVPAGSSIAAPADLKGRTLVCTVPSSIVGYRAALVLLAQNVALRPEVDYYITWSMGQKQSIKGIARKEYEAAAVSSDRLQRMLATGSISQDQFRVIYESQVVPRTTIGWFYNLKPDLAEKVKEAILDFQATTQPDQTAAADSESSDSANHFVPINYRGDFDLVRMIDDSFEPRLDAKTKLAAVPSTQPTN